MSITPLGHRILVKKGDAEEKLTRDLGNGKKLFIATENKRAYENSIADGILVAVGKQAWKAFGNNFSGEPWAKVGDHVTFSPHAGRNIKDPETGELFVIMNDDDLTAVISKG